MAGVGGTPQQWEEGLGEKEGLRGQPSETSVRFPRSRGTRELPELGVNKGPGCLQVGRAQGDCWERRARVIPGILHPEQRPRAGRRGARLRRGTHHPGREPAKLYHQSQQGQTPLEALGCFPGTTQAPRSPPPWAPGSPQWSRREPAGLTERRRRTPSRKEAEGRVAQQQARCGGVGGGWPGGQGSPKRGKRLQAADIFSLSLKRQEGTNYKGQMLSPKILCCHDDTWFHLNLLFSNPEVTSAFSLRYVNETMYLLWNVPFFKMAPPKTLSFLKPWADSSSTNQYSCQLFYGWGMTHHPISKMHVVGEGPGETPSALRCLSYPTGDALVAKSCLTLACP